jgi:lysophospholipase-2
MWSVENPSEQEEIQKEGLRESISAIVEVIHQEARIITPSHIFLGGISQGSATAILALLCSDMKLGGFVGLCTWMPFRNSVLEIARKHKHDTQDQEQATNQGALSLLSQPSSQGSTSKSSHVAEKIRGLLGVVRGTSVENDTNTNINANAANTLATPVFLSHSKNDEVVPIQNGRLLRDCLETLGMKVTWKEYEDGGHWIYEPEDENVRNGIDDIEEFVGLYT